jgi:hypothetical protein
MPVYDPEKEKSDIARYIEEMVKSIPGAKYVLPDPYDPSSYIHPVVGISKSAFTSAVEKLLGKESSIFAKRLPRGAIKDIDKLGTFSEVGWGEYKKSHPSYRAAYARKGVKYSDQPKPLSETITAIDPTMAMPKTPYHEVGHNIFEELPRKEKDLLDKVYSSLGPEKRTDLIHKTDTNLFDANELFAEAYSRYITGDKLFDEFPTFVKHIVKKYHKLMR